VQEALVDTGSALLCLHGTSIQELGLVEDRKVGVRTANGQAARSVYAPVRITIHDRHCCGEVMEVPDDVPVLVGYIPLESLDLVVDPGQNAVVPDPASGGKYTLDLI
jgi:predicted aspartyl protease